MYDDDSPYIRSKPVEENRHQNTDSDHENLEDDNEFHSIRDEFEQVSLQGTFPPAHF